jgi:serine/threonine-protein phosphatase 2A regulatory subunit A
MAEPYIPNESQTAQPTRLEASAAILTSLLENIDKVDLSSLTPAVLPVILEITGETRWRAKIATIKLIPAFTKVLGDFSCKIFLLVSSWLADSIYPAREKISQQLGPLVQIFETDWAITSVFQALLQFKGHQSYLTRQVTLMFLNRLTGCLPVNLLAKHFLSIVLQLANEKVANVKMMVANTHQSGSRFLRTFNRLTALTITIHLNFLTKAHPNFGFHLNCFTPLN